MPSIFHKYRRPTVDFPPYAMYPAAFLNKTLDPPTKKPDLYPCSIQRLSPPKGNKVFKKVYKEEERLPYMTSALDLSFPELKTVRLDKDFTPEPRDLSADDSYTERDNGKI